MANRPGLPLSSELEPSTRRWFGPVVDILARLTAQSLSPLKSLTGSLGGDSLWREPTTVNAGWVGTDAKFCMDEDGIVRLRGSFTHPGPLALPAVIYTLALEYWPSTERRFATTANGAFAEVSVTAIGGVVLRAGSLTGVYLDCVTYAAKGVMPRANRDAVNAVRSKVNELIARLERD